MSNHQEMSGSYRLPAGVGPKIRKSLVQFLAQRIKTQLTRRQQFCMNLRSLPAAVIRDSDALAKELVPQWLHAAGRGPYGGISTQDGSDLYRDLCAICPHTNISRAFSWTNGPPYSVQLEPVRIRKSDFHLVKAKDVHLPNSKTFLFCAADYGSDASELQIQFSPDSRVLEIDIDRNNHAVRDAYACEIFQHLMKELDAVKWTRNSGGWLRYTDEYRDEMDPMFADTRHAKGPVGVNHQTGIVEAVSAYARSTSPGF